MGRGSRPVQPRLDPAGQARRTAGTGRRALADHLRLHGYRWEHAVRVRLDLTAGPEIVSLDIEGQPTLIWSGPGVAPMAVAAIFHLYGPVAMIEHPGPAALRVPLDGTATGRPDAGPARIEPQSNPDS